MRRAPAAKAPHCRMQKSHVRRQDPLIPITVGCCSLVSENPENMNNDENDGVVQVRILLHYSPQGLKVGPRLFISVLCL